MAKFLLLPLALASVASAALRVAPSARAVRARPALLRTPTITAAAADLKRASPKTMLQALRGNGLVRTLSRPSPLPRAPRGQR